MKRYFDLPNSRLVAELDIISSKASTLSVEDIKKEMNWKDDIIEVNKARYEILTEQYSK